MSEKIDFSRMKIAVVDDHDLVREGMNAVLVANGATDVDKFRTATELMNEVDAGCRRFRADRYDQGP